MIWFNPPFSFLNVFDLFIAQMCACTRTCASSCVCVCVCVCVRLCVCSCGPVRLHRTLHGLISGLVSWIYAISITVNAIEKNYQNYQFFYIDCKTNYTIGRNLIFFNLFHLLFISAVLLCHFLSNLMASHPCNFFVMATAKFGCNEVKWRSPQFR